MAYEKTVWENGQTPLNASNMNKIEQGIYDNSVNLGTKLYKHVIILQNYPADANYSGFTVNSDGTITVDGFPTITSGNKILTIVTTAKDKNEIVAGAQIISGTLQLSSETYLITGANIVTGIFGRIDLSLTYNSSSSKMAYTLHLPTNLVVNGEDTVTEL